MRASAVVVDVVPPLLALLLGFFVGDVFLFGDSLFFRDLGAHLEKGGHHFGIPQAKGKVCIQNATPVVPICDISCMGVSVGAIKQEADKRRKEVWKHKDGVYELAKHRIQLDALLLLVNFLLFSSQRVFFFFSLPLVLFFSQ